MEFIIHDSLEEIRQWYRENNNLSYLQPHQIDTIEKIVRGIIPSDQISHCAKGPVGFHSDYNRTCAAQILQIVDETRAYEPIVTWIKDLAERENYRHWTSCCAALDRFSHYFFLDSFRERLAEAIPYLATLALDADPKRKGYPEYATVLLIGIKTDASKKVLQTVARDSENRFAKSRAEVSWALA